MVDLVITWTMPFVLIFCSNYLSSTVPPPEILAPSYSYPRTSIIFIWLSDDRPRAFIGSLVAPLVRFLTLMLYLVSMLTEYEGVLQLLYMFFTDALLPYLIYLPEVVVIFYLTPISVHIQLPILYLWPL